MKVKKETRESGVHLSGNCTVTVDKYRRVGNAQACAKLSGTLCLEKNFAMGGDEVSRSTSKHDVPVGLGKCALDVLYQGRLQTFLEDGF